MLDAMELKQIYSFIQQKTSIEYRVSSIEYRVSSIEYRKI
jgi:hypothetical protein